MGKKKKKNRRRKKRASRLSFFLVLVLSLSRSLSLDSSKRSLLLFFDIDPGHNYIRSPKRGEKEKRTTTRQKKQYYAPTFPVLYARLSHLLYFVDTPDTYPVRFF